MPNNTYVPATVRNQGGADPTDTPFVALSKTDGTPVNPGDATAANQTTQITALGAPADAEATANGSIIAILKRLRTLLAGGLPAALGTQTAANSLSVVQASNDPSSVAQGTTTDTAYAGSGASTVISLLKGLYAAFVAATPAGTNLMGKVNIVGNSVTYTDRSGTITTGGTQQTLAASNASRAGFFIQNLSTGDLWINSLANAVTSQPSLKVPAGALYESPAIGVPTGAISIIGATTGQAFAAREW